MKYNATISIPGGRSGPGMSRKMLFILVAVFVALLGVSGWFLSHGGWLRSGKFFSTSTPAASSVAKPVTAAVAATAAPTIKTAIAETVAAPVPVAQTTVAPVTETSVTVAPPVAQTTALPVPVTEIAVPKPVAAPTTAARPMAAAPAAPVTRVANKVATPAPKAAPQPVVKISPFQQAANTAFGNLINVANVNPDACGFRPGDSLLHAKLGEPIQLYQVASGQRYKVGEPVKSLLKPSERWMIPVMVGNQIRCMVQVKRDGQEFVSGNPSKILGVAWGKIIETWPTAAGFHPQLIVNPDMPGYYFSVPELAQPNLTDTDKVIFAPGDISPASVILASWR